MSKGLRWAAVLVLAAMSTAPAAAQQALQHSPITPGFWSWPREKAVGPQAISNACREKVAVQFADGRYFGLKLRNAENKSLPAPVVDEVGFCRFDPTTQVERCELRITNDDGTIKTGTIESTFAIGADKTIKMTVAPKTLNGAPSTATAFDVFPTPCPDIEVWNNLNGSPVAQ